VDDSNRVRGIILGHLPGESLPMKVRRRDGEGALVELDVQVRLASYAQLQNATAPDPQLRRDGFRARVVRKRREMDAAAAVVRIGAEFDAVDWLAAEGAWPPPGPDTPIGETGIARVTGRGAGEALALAGQPRFAARAGAVERPDAFARERALARNIGERAGSTAFEEVLAAYRITLLNIARIDERFLRLSRTPGDANAEARTRQRREREQQMATLMEFAEMIRQGPGAVED
ncbi:MAG: hypothetical protein AAF235_00240, partial [Planctomycetota bacterium]